MKVCDHKFADSNVCLKCGWRPLEEPEEELARLREENMLLHKSLTRMRAELDDLVRRLQHAQGVVSR